MEKISYTGRLAMMRGLDTALPPIDVSRCVRWAEHDPVLQYAWSERLPESFSNVDFAMFPDVGHFPHREDPYRAAAEIRGFFKRLDWA